MPPQSVVRRDGDDPYLVVAADKGTGSFSDIANAISDEHGFWLSDAFASGGSAGYDHKEMGITARGAWEGIKRHFRELDIDIQTTPFTVAGVGDVGLGDVFGNGMLQSLATRLVAAVRSPRHLHRPRSRRAGQLHGTPAGCSRCRGRAGRTTAVAGDRPAGGGVFSRGDKAIRLSREMQALLRLTGERATPAEVMRAILKAPVDLLWFGGIGTFVKGHNEGDEKVGDRANDATRITAPEIGARVVGEGANLGMTQRARVEYGLGGGRCNSDAIDNSAGVNTSDVEVNIKIAFRHALAEGRIDREGRDHLLKAMTDRRNGAAAAFFGASSCHRQSLSRQTLTISSRRAARHRGFRLPAALHARSGNPRPPRSRPGRAARRRGDDRAAEGRQAADPGRDQGCCSPTPS